MGNIKTKIAKLLCITTLFSFTLHSNMGIIRGQGAGAVDPEQSITNLTSTTEAGITVDLEEKNLDSGLPLYDVLSIRVYTDFDDFTNTIDGVEAPTPWGFLNQKLGDNNVIGLDYDEERGTVAEFKTSQASNLGLIRYFNNAESPKVTGTVLLEGKFNFKDTNTERRLFLPNGKAHLALKANTNGTLTFGSTTIGDYETDRWYHIQMIINNDAGEMELFIDGVKQGDNHSMGTERQIDHIRFMQIGIANTDSSMYVDDLGIQEIRIDGEEGPIEPEPEPDPDPEEPNPDDQPIETENMVENASFEELLDNTGNAWDSDQQAVGWGTWRATGSPKFEVVEDKVYDGQYAVRISTDEVGRGSVSSPDIPVVVGRKYTVSARIKTEHTDRPGAKAQARMRVTPYDSDSKQIPNSYTQSSLVVGAADWQTLSVEYEIPKNTKYVKIGLFMENSTGTVVWYDDISMYPLIPVTSIDLGEDKEIMIGQDLQLNPEITPVEGSRVFNWESSDNSIATVVDGKVTGVGIGEVTITAKWAYDETIQASLKLNVVIDPANHIPVESIQFNEDRVEVIERGFGKLNWTINPQSATIQKVDFTVEDPDIALVQETGEIIGLKIGETTVTVTTADATDAKDTATIVVVEAQRDEFDDMREKWENQLLGTPYNQNDQKVKEILLDVTEVAQKQWDSMEKAPNRTYLWKDLRNTDKDVPTATANSADVRSMYGRLLNMTKAYKLPGSELEANQVLLQDIIDGLDFLFENHYYPGRVAYSNWWNWEIGVPIDLNNITVLLYNELSPVQVKNYMDAIEYFQPDPTKSGANGEGTTNPGLREAVGANRVDVSKAVAVRGIIVKDGEKIANSRDALSQVFEYVDEMDGFYKDGSFVQHGNIPYTGSYGSVLIDGVATLLDALHGTSWEVTDQNVDNIYKAVIDSFEPLLYKGAIMDMVSGRAISRPVGDHGRGHGIINAIINLIPSAPDYYANYYKSFVKNTIEEDTFKSYLDGIENMHLYSQALAIANDSIIPKRKDYIKHVQFPSMDRVVHHQKDYVFGVASHSNRIGNYETMNGENTKGWYTGDGMTYLYNTDLGHYTHYWPTVNALRMPGTTEARASRDKASGQRRFPNRDKGMSSKSWVGGAALRDQYGTWGMDFESWDQSLEAKKSWFMFDKEIVALGAGIDSKASDIIETTVENRKLSETKNDLIRAGNDQVDKTITTQEKLDNVKWVHLESGIDGSDIGYYFPTDQEVYGMQQTRVGKYKDIHDAGSDDEIESDFFTMWIEHGEQPQNETYEYVLLPNQTLEETKQYAQNPDIIVLANTEEVQAVKHTRLNTVGINFWTDTVQRLDKITSHNKAAVMMEEQNGQLEISVSDPTMENSGKIELEIDAEAYHIISKDPRITVEQISPSIKLTVDVNNSKGQSFAVTLRTEDKQDPTDPVDPVDPKPENPGSNTGGGGGVAKPKENPSKQNISDGKGQVTIGEGNVSLETREDVVRASLAKENVVKAIEQAVKETVGTTRPQVVVSLPDVTGKDISLEMETEIIREALEKKVDMVLKTQVIQYRIPFGALGDLELQADETIAFSFKDLGQQEVESKKSNEKVLKVIELNLLAKSNNQSRLITQFSQPIEIKVSIEGLGDPNKLGIYYLNEEEGTLDFASNNVEDGFIIMKTNHYSQYAILEVEEVAPIQLSDIEGHWAKVSIESIVAKGIAGGYPDGTFKPNNSITRAEFVAMMNSLLELETVSYKGEFGDVKAGDWFANSIATAAANGLVGGYPDGTFNPNGNITRAEMMSIISKTIKDINISADEIDTILAPFADKNQVETWAKESIAKVVKAGIIGGMDSKIQGKAETTRAQAAAVIDRMLNRK